MPRRVAARQIPELIGDFTFGPAYLGQWQDARDNRDKSTKTPVPRAGVALAAPARDPAPRLALVRPLLGFAARDWPRGGAGSDWPRRSHEGSVFFRSVCVAQVSVPGCRWEGVPDLSAPAGCGGPLWGFAPGSAVRGGSGWAGRTPAIACPGGTRLCGLPREVAVLGSGVRLLICAAGR